MEQAQIVKVIGKSSTFVSKWCNHDLSDPKNFYDSPRKGAPVTALTPKNMKKLSSCKEKLGQSKTVLRDKLGISSGSVSNGFKKLGLFAYRRGVQSRLKRKHIKIRFKASKVMRHKGIKFWERLILRTTECVQNVKRTSNQLDAINFQESGWSGGMNARALAALVPFKVNVNGTVYQKKFMFDDVMKRKKTNGFEFTSEKWWQRTAR